MARDRVFETVAEELAMAIRSGELPEGGRLPSERDLVVRFGVSRMAVREALLSLDAMGLIETRARARAIVRAVRSESLLDPMTATVRSALGTPEGVADFQSARLLFECGLVRYAATYASPKELERLGEALLANRRSLGDLAQFVVTDMAFHAILAEIPQNSVFIGLNASLAGWLADQRAPGIKRRGTVRTAYAHHERIFEAIASRSPAAAEEAMEEHLSWVASFPED